MNAPLPTLELIAHATCPYVQRASAVLQARQLPHTRTEVDLANKPAWLLELSPLGKVPLLLVTPPNGPRHRIAESLVICEYLDTLGPTPSLLPADPLNKARHKAWMEFSGSLLMGLSSSFGAKTEAEFDTAWAEVARKLAMVAQSDVSPTPLEARRFFDGPEPAMVDLVFAPVLRYVATLEAALGKDLLSPANPWLKAWQGAVLALPAVQAAVGADYPAVFAARLRKDPTTYLAHRLAQQLG
jgi:glutathione S-transferase